MLTPDPVPLLLTDPALLSKPIAPKGLLGLPPIPLERPDGGPVAMPGGGPLGPDPARGIVIIHQPGLTCGGQAL